MVLQAVDDAGNASRKRCAGVRNAVAHGVAGADLHGDPALAGQLHELVRKRHDKTVEIRSRDIFKMTARPQSGLNAVGHDADVAVHRLASGQAHFPKDMIVRAADEDAGLLDPQGLRELEILLGRADPRRDLRKIKPEVEAAVHGLTVLLGVHEKFCLADHAVGAAELVQQLVDVHHLVGRVRRAGLLAVAERRVGQVDVFGHIFRDASIVERDLRRLGVRVDFPEELGLRHILKLIDVRVLLKFVGFVAEADLSHFPHLVS